MADPKIIAHCVWCNKPLHQDPNEDVGCLLNGYYVGDPEVTVCSDSHYELYSKPKVTWTNGPS